MQRIIDRRLTAHELLLLQGFGADLQARSTVGAFSQSQVTDLAGNAFCAGVCVASILAAIIAIPHREVFALSSALRAKASPLPCVDEAAASSSPAAPAPASEPAQELDVQSSGGESDFEFE